MYKKYILFFLAILIPFCSLQAKIDYVIEKQPQAIEMAIALEGKGILKQKKNGFVYLDVTNDFVEKVTPHLEVEGRFIPLKTGDESLGAHISVITEQERRKSNIPDLDVLNSEFSFEVKEIRSFYNNGSRLFAVIVESEELEGLRESFGLTAKLKNHDFHITLGKQAASSGEDDEKPYYEPSENEELSDVDYEVCESKEIIELAKSFSLSGTLKQKDNGFVYLDVSNEYLDELAPFIELHPELCEKCRFEGRLVTAPTSKRSIGAHISVFTQSELAKHEIWNIFEIGQTFDFEIDEIRTFTTRTQKGLKKLWVISVKSEGLKKLRQSYGLNAYLKGNDFHITLGKQMPVGNDMTGGLEVISPLNFMSDQVEGLLTEGDFEVMDQQEVLTLANQLEGFGRLKLKSNGFVYLDVSNDFITEIAANIKAEGNLKPNSTKSTGAHISVIHEDEMIKNQVWVLDEAEQIFTFDVKELRRINANGKALWVLAVESKGLERLRAKYGLPFKLQKHDFHITIGEETIFTPKSAEIEEDRDAA